MGLRALEERWVAEKGMGKAMGKGMVVGKGKGIGMGMGKRGKEWEREMVEKDEGYYGSESSEESEEGEQEWEVAVEED